MSRNKFEVGQVLYNHGDMANASGWYEIVEIIDDPRFSIGYKLQEIGDLMRNITITENAINTTDRNNGSTRIVTKKARIEYVQKTYGINTYNGRDDEVCKALENNLENEINELRSKMNRKMEILDRYDPNTGIYEDLCNMYLSEIEEMLKDEELKIMSKLQNNKSIEEQINKTIEEIVKYILLTDNNIDYQVARGMAKKMLRAI